MGPLSPERILWIFGSRTFELTCLANERKAASRLPRCYFFFFAAFFFAGAFFFALPFFDAIPYPPHWEATRGASSRSQARTASPPQPQPSASIEAHACTSQETTSVLEIFF